MFPYKGWVLTPSFKPVEVTLFREVYSEFHVAENGKWHIKDDICDTKDIAIEMGKSKLERQQAAICKRQEALNKRKANLEKWGK